MISAIKFEFVRITTLRSTMIILGLAIVLNAALPIILTALSDDRLTSARAAMLVVGGVGIVPEFPPFSAMMIGLLGALSVGHDYRYGTMTPTLLVIPRRGVVVSAKLIVLIAVTLATSLLSLAINTGLVAAIEREPVPLGGQAYVVGGYLLLMVGWAVLGLGATLAFRQTLGALAFLFGGAVVIELILRSLTMIPALAEFKSAVRYLPFAAGNALAQGAGGRLGIGIEPLSKPQYAAVYLVFVLVVLVCGWLRFSRSDA